MKKPKRIYPATLSIKRLRDLAEKWEPKGLRAATNVFSAVTDFINFVDVSRSSLSGRPKNPPLSARPKNS